MNENINQKLKPLDLTWGNAAFLYPFWERRAIMNSDLGEHMSYGEILNDLEKAIGDLHAKEKNVDLQSGNYHIVIGNGATQVIQAAISGLCCKHVIATAPYFQRFPAMAAMAGASFSTEASVSAEGYLGYNNEIVTVPNNPDGKINLATFAMSSGTIYDVCYNWPQYMISGHPILMNKDILVFSLAKATGHAGTRIGWALVRDHYLAARMRYFIEHQSCGVSIEAQQKAVAIIENHLIGFESVMEYGHAKLRYRWQRLAAEGLTAEDSNGMFLWIREPSRGFFANLEIHGIQGSAFGGSDEYIRLNMGCSDENFEEFLRRVSGTWDEWALYR